VILKPSVVALLVSSALTVGLLAYAAYWGAVILRRWDLRSGTSVQLELERRTYLVSTLVACALGLELASLFLFIRTADALAPLFTGAMCAAGSLKVNGLGYPALGLKVVGALAAGLWLVVNHADASGADYPLIRKKYALLLAIAPLVVADALLQAGYFALLRPEVITSCCGSLFGRSGRGLGAELAALPPRLAGVALFATLALVISAGLVFLRSRRAGYLLAALSASALPVGIAGIVAYLSPYVYELPTHHCPFCLLQKEYGYVGYALYAALLGGAVGGIGVGALTPFRRIASLRASLPAVQRRLAWTAVALFGAFGAIAICSILRSHLRMG
jgi:hypothetical protein